MPSSQGHDFLPSGRKTQPDWLPEPVVLYLSHTEDGVSLRALARQVGVNPSTVMRQVRRYENRRDDPLMDGALEALRPLRDAAVDLAAQDDPGAAADATPASAAILPTSTGLAAPLQQDDPVMTPTAHPTLGAAVLRKSSHAGAPGAALPDEAALRRDARRYLRRLAEPGAVLAYAPEMEKAVILREFPDGRSTRTAIIDRSVAQAFSLKDWISCRKSGRVSTYEISPAGRAILRRMLEEDGQARQGLSEARHGFGPSAQGGAATTGRRGRGGMGETPLAILARRMDSEGQPFLSGALVRAAEQLHEDFELAQLAPHTPQHWGRMRATALTPAPATHCGGQTGAQTGAACQARDRVAAALEDLGPDLGDVAFRVCCLQEGVEATERRMGWTARSGKIVLRIALLRLSVHYEARYGRAGPLIG